MLETLNNLDTQWFYWVNQHHTPLLDHVLWASSQHWCWAVAIAVLFAAGPLRREPRRWWLAAAGIGLCFLLADQLSVHLFKETVCRLRPCHALEGVRMYRTSCGGQYGFISSHAANSFAIAGFLWLRYRRWEGHSRWRAMAVPALAMAWAFTTCYSRPYLGKHYPGDMICGALFGLLVAVAVWMLAGAVEKRLKKSETK